MRTRGRRIQSKHVRCKQAWGEHVRTSRSQTRATDGLDKKGTTTVEHGALVNVIAKSPRLIQWIPNMVKGSYGTAGGSTLLHHTDSLRMRTCLQDSNPCTLSLQQIQPIANATTSDRHVIRLPTKRWSTVRTFRKSCAEVPEVPNGSTS